MPHTYSGILRELCGDSHSHMCWLFVENNRGITPVLCEWEKVKQLGNSVGQQITWTIDPVTNYLEEVK